MIYFHYRLTNVLLHNYYTVHGKKGTGKKGTEKMGTGKKGTEKRARKKGHGKKGTGKMGTGKIGTSEILGKKDTKGKKMFLFVENFYYYLINIWTIECTFFVVVCCSIYF